MHSQKKLAKKRRRVVITGLGAIASNGIGKDAFWNAIVKGKSGIKRISSFDPSSYPSQVAGEITDFDAANYIDAKIVRRVDRFTQFGMAAAIMAVDDSGIKINENASDKIGVVIGTSLAGLGFGEAQHDVFKKKGVSKVSPFVVTALLTSDCPSEISMYLGFKGPSMAVSTACASGGDAIGYAFDLIRKGEVDLMVTGGAEAPITPFSMAAFCAARVLSVENDEPEKASRPFDKYRDGMVVSEGAGILVLEELEHALRRNAYIYAEVIGYGRSCDAYHITQPLPTGKEAARAMKSALNDGNIAPEDVDYINAHGSSTELNDKVETFVIKDVFGKYAYDLPISSIKSMIGHPQGACGGLELIVSALAIRDGILPPTINYEEPDPECDLNYVPNKSRNAKINIVMSNNFGFGGKNVSLLIRKFKG
ncbi:MAG: beta-ketoacyl-ACP synthase II [Candidatus Omnitrophota bacterium]